MPVTYRFDDNIFVLELTGHYSVDEMKTKILEALDDPSFPADAVLLMDLRLDESVQERTTQELRDMSFFFSDFKDRINRRMCMVASNDLAIGLMNMAKVYDYNKGITSKVFNDMDKGLAWLLSGAQD